MAGSSTQEMAIEAIVILNAAFTNIRLYPPTSDMIGNSINSAYDIFQDIFNQDDSVVFAVLDIQWTLLSSNTSGQFVNRFSDHFLCDTYPTSTSA